jgi:hypothetical protein
MKLSTVRSHHPSTHPSIHPSIIHLHRVTHSLTITQLFGVSAIITGAIAITGKASSISGKAFPISGKASPISGMASSISHALTSTASPLTVVTELPDIPVTLMDQVHVSFGYGEDCNMTTFDREHYIHENMCYGQDQPFTTISTRVVTGMMSNIRGDDLSDDRCVLVTFADNNCTSGGTILQDLTRLDSSDTESDDEEDPFKNVTLPPKSCVEVYTKPGVQRIPARSVKWICGDDIDKHWVDPFDSDDEDDLPVSARSVDTTRDKDHVTVTPADNLNCNSAQHRDTDTKVQGHCHPFDKPFFSLRADVKRSEDHSVIGGSEPCSVLVFSDKKCRRDGASIVDLNNTPALGVCHNVTLHHGNNDAAIAGHSWKWVCGRQNIENCLKPVHHPKAHHSKAHNTVVGSVTKTVTATATTSLACSMTTEFAHYLDVLTSIITLKPVTHTSTSVFTKTKTQIRTKIITSVATDVSTVHHSVTKPYTTTYMVCDVNQGSQV